MFFLFFFDRRYEWPVTVHTRHVFRSNKVFKGRGTEHQRKHQSSQYVRFDQGTTVRYYGVCGGDDRATQRALGLACPVGGSSVQVKSPLGDSLAGRRLAARPTPLLSLRGTEPDWLLGWLVGDSVAVSVCVLSSFPSLTRPACLPTYLFLLPLPQPYVSSPPISLSLFN